MTPRTKVRHAASTDGDNRTQKHDTDNACHARIQPGAATTRTTMPRHRKSAREAHDIQFDKVTEITRVANRLTCLKLQSIAVIYHIEPIIDIVWLRSLFFPFSVRVTPAVSLLSQRGRHQHHPSDIIMISHLPSHNYYTYFQM